MSGDRGKRSSQRRAAWRRVRRRLKAKPPPELTRRGRCGWMVRGWGYRTNDPRNDTISANKFSQGQLLGSYRALYTRFNLRSQAVTAVAEPREIKTDRRLAGLDKHA